MHERLLNCCEGMPIMKRTFLLGAAAAFLLLAGANGAMANAAAYGHARMSAVIFSADAPAHKITCVPPARFCKKH